MPYGCNDNIKGVGNLSSPGCSEINVMNLCNTNPRAKRSLLMLLASIPLLANGIWRNFLLLSRRGSDPTGLKRRKDATSHIILDNLYFVEKRSTLDDDSSNHREYLPSCKQSIT
jgi:hypothetical protein